MRAKVPGVAEDLARAITAFMQSLRHMELSRIPGVSETLDWAAALLALDAREVNEAIVRETLGCLLKDAADTRRVADALSSERVAAMAAIPT